MHVAVEQILCGPRGQSKIRKQDETQFVVLSGIFFQYYSPSTVPRLFPAEGCAESLPGNRVLLLIHSNWNKMQLSSLFTQTHNPQRLQPCHSIQRFILTLADGVQGCLLGHFTLKHHVTGDGMGRTWRSVRWAGIFSYLSLKLLCFPNTVLSSLCELILPLACLLIILILISYSSLFLTFQRMTSWCLSSTFSRRHD